MWKFFSKIILRNRLLIIILIIGSTAFMAYKGKQAKLSYTLAKLLPDNHQVNINYNSFLEKYGHQDILVIAVEDNQLTDYNHLVEWQMLSDEVRILSGVKELISITTLPILLKDTVSNQFFLRKWFSSKIINQAEVDSALDNFNAQPFYENIILNADNNIAIFLISLENKIVRSANREHLIFQIKHIFDDYCKKLNAKPHFSGLPYIRTVDSLMVKHEIAMFILLALLVTALILFFLFRSLKATLSSIIVVVIGVIFCFGTIVLLGYEISIFMALVPPVIIVIGIPNCVFLINKFHIEFRNSSNKKAALHIMIEKIGNITLLTNLTTAAGFASFLLTNSKTLQEFGAVASLNILIIFILSLLIIPIYFSYGGDPKSRHTKHLDKRWVKFLVFSLDFLVQRKRKQIYLVTILLLGVAFFGIINVKTTGNLTDDLPKDQILYKDLKFLEKHFGGVMPLEVLIDTKKKQGLLKSYNLQKIEKLTDLLTTYKEFSRPVSYVDVIKYSKQAFYNGDSSYYYLPNSQEHATILSYLKNSNNNLGFESLLIDSLAQQARISLRMADISTSKMDSIFNQLIPQINNIFDSEKYDVIVTGTSIVFLNGTKFLLRNLALSLFLVIILISAFIAWLFNSFKMVIISIIPNIIPLLLTAAIMGYFSIALKPSTILVFSIAFGISVDDTIHFLAKYRQELLENKGKIKASVLSALKETGVSMFYTSVVLFSGFFIFVASDFGGTIALGLLVSIALMIAMLSNLLLLPALLLSLEKVLNYKATDARR
ncbi:MAG: transporter [Flavobacteriales bacterium]|nr:transporter [Flavobacteriales bacterium]